jgi:hypothetical protein
MAEFSAGKGDSGVAGAQRRAAPVRVDLYGAADQQEGAHEGMDEFGGLQRSGMGFGCHHDRAHPGSRVHHRQADDAAG